MKRLGVLLLPLGGMLVHRRSLPGNLLGFPQQFAGTHLYSWVERGTVRVKCLPKNTTQCPRPGRHSSGIVETFSNTNWGEFCLHPEAKIKTSKLWKEKPCQCASLLLCNLYLSYLIIASLKVSNTVMWDGVFFFYSCCSFFIIFLGYNSRNTQ